MDTKVCHVTGDSDITFKVEQSKVNLQGAGVYLVASRTACSSSNRIVNIASTCNDSKCS